MNSVAKKLFEQASNGNQEALSFLVIYNNACHAIDDVVDKVITDSEKTLESYTLFLAVTQHPYFIKNHNSLMPILILSINDYMDSNKVDDKLADSLRFSGNYMVKIVAFIEGGWLLVRLLSTALNNLAYETHHTEDGKPI